MSHNPTLSLLSKATQWLARTNIALFSLALYAIILAQRFLIHLFNDVIGIPDIKYREKLMNSNYNVTFDLVLDTLLFAPILERLVSQSLFFNIYNRIKINRWVIIALSSITFGLIHNYSLVYMISTAFSGAIFMFLHIERAQAKNKPLASTIIAHSFINSTAIIAAPITQYVKN